MFYVIYGTDTEKSREKARGLFDTLRIKKPDAAAGTITADGVTTAKIEELTQSQGLFENKQIILMDRTLEDLESREIILDTVDALKESPNIFIFLEGKLTKEVLKKIEKRAEKVQEYELDQSTPKESSSLFPMADAFGSRDKKKLWVMYRQAMDNDAVPEEIHGILFWQAKSMVLAAKSNAAGDAGLNPFVFSKSKRFCANFKEGELDIVVSNLVHMYHRAHRGEIDFERELEKFVLDI